jgi:hypothetical protein
MSVPALPIDQHADAARDRLLWGMGDILRRLEALDEKCEAAAPGTFDRLRAMIGSLARMDRSALLGAQTHGHPPLWAAVHEMNRLLEVISARVHAFLDGDDAHGTNGFPCPLENAAE